MHQCMHSPEHAEKGWGDTLDENRQPQRPDRGRQADHRSTGAVGRNDGPLPGAGGSDRAPAFLHHRRAHLAGRSAHAADPRLLPRHAAQGDHRQPGRGRGPLPDDPHGLPRRRQRRPAGPQDPLQDTDPRHVRGGPADALPRRHRHVPGGAHGVRRGERHPLRRVPVVEPGGGRGAHPPLLHRHRAGLLDADRLRLGLFVGVHGPAGALPGGGMPVHGAPDLPHRRQAPGRMGPRRPAGPALPGGRHPAPRTLPCPAPAAN